MNEHSHKRHKSEEDRQGVPAEMRPEAAETAAAQDPPSGQERTALPAEGTVSAEEFARLLAEKEELTSTLVRRQADFENYRKRVERQSREEARSGIRRLLLDLLPVLDGFDRALAAHPAEDEYRKGVQLIQRHLWDTLSRHGLERIAAEGKAFDPHYHEAIERVETHEHPEGTILQVVQEGYLFDGRVLRPTWVRVAVAPADAGGDLPSAEHSRAH